MHLDARPWPCNPRTTCTTSGGGRGRGYPSARCGHGRGHGRHDDLLSHGGLFHGRHPVDGPYRPSYPFHYLAYLDYPSYLGYPSDPDLPSYLGYPSFFAPARARALAPAPVHILYPDRAFGPDLFACLSLCPCSYPPYLYPADPGPGLLPGRGLGDLLLFLVRGVGLSHPAVERDRK